MAAAAARLAPSAILTLLTVALQLSDYRSNEIAALLLVLAALWAAFVYAVLPIRRRLAGYALQSPLRSPLVRKRLTIEQLKKAIIDARVDAAASPTIPSLPAWLRTLPEPRVYLPDEVTPRSLVDQLNGLTELEGQERMKKNIGKWMRVSGTFDDLSERGWPQGQLSMELEHNPKPGDLSPVYVTATFEGSWRSRLEILSKGTPVWIA